MAEMNLKFKVGAGEQKEKHFYHCWTQDRAIEHSKGQSQSLKF